MNQRLNEPGKNYDAGKLRYDLIPVRPLEMMTEVFTYGATKYEDRNWEKGMSWSRCFAAAMRHLWLWWRGERDDKESGLSHLAHAAARIFFLMEYEENIKGTDDRAKSKPKEFVFPKKNPIKADPVKILQDNDYGN